MIVDLVRNDLGRVAVTGSVTRARTAGGAARARRVASGVDGVRAGRRPTCRCAAVLDATFPPASVTGTPKAPGPRAACRLGAASARSLLRHSRFGVTRRGLRTERGDPHRRVRRARQRGARRRRRHHRRLRSRRASGTSACTRRHRSSSSVLPAARQTRQSSLGMPSRGTTALHVNAEPRRRARGATVRPDATRSPARTRP